MSYFVSVAIFVAELAHRQKSPTQSTTHPADRCAGNRSFCFGTSLRLFSFLMRSMKHNWLARYAYVNDTDTFMKPKVCDAK